MAKILVIDDSPLARSILCDCLRKLGHEPLAAATAPEALTLCMEHHPDLAIKDIVMKDTDLFDFMRDLRRLSADLPIVVCSTAGRRHEICAAIRGGATDFLLKPIDPDDVGRTIARYAMSG